MIQLLHYNMRGRLINFSYPPLAKKLKVDFPESQGASEFIFAKLHLFQVIPRECWGLIMNLQ